MIVSCDRHRDSFDTGTIQRTSMRSLASLLECKNSETKTRKKCPDCELPARPSDLSPLGHLRHFERPLEMSAMPPIATKNGEPLKRRRRARSRRRAAARERQAPVEGPAPPLAWPVVHSAARWGAAASRRPGPPRKPDSKQAPLFDHLVGAGEKGFGDGQPERLGGF
jgi:hypothetical protein